MRKLFAVIAASALAGCASVEDVAQNSPLGSTMSTKDLAALENCVSTTWRDQKATVERFPSDTGIRLSATYFFYAPTVVATADIAEANGQRSLTVRSTGKGGDKKLARLALDCA